MLRGNANGTIKGVPLNKGQQALVAADRPDNFWGYPQNTITSNSAPTVDTSRYIFRNNSPFPIMTASEMKFVKAEAAFKMGNKALALQAYKEGITASIDMLVSTYSVNVPPSRAITPASQNAFLTNPVIVPTDPTQLTLSKIMLQKYIAMFGYGILETWVDMRRYHYIDADPSGTGQVYADFAPPSGGDLYPDNLQSPNTGEFSQYVYRVRPRFNSEYVWNINELTRIGATTPYYHTKKIWIAQ
jgi:hypothetical protein